MTSTFLLQSEYALTSTLANEVVCREYNEHIRENMSLARHLGSAQATRKFLSFLPFPPQFTCDSFYFDHSLFKPIPRKVGAAEVQYLTHGGIPDSACRAFQIFLCILYCTSISADISEHFTYPKPSKREFV
ncbi:hypothetical protein AX774_g2620 [Zancudomyces culisetae]|uniref:Uncharacterized protein n=1 Tax=Zancudomyces culisetae TaxID=1213189 RepID=A0A1R1PSA4_ZANCU|nr:hypothetical protein AX774_g2620 [Zancudomyces culisetae]|eukprot:OMH83865.1 hypothetical protein AX774_g2620 [Zancudomyces culisetae]